MKAATRACLGVALAAAALLLSACEPFLVPEHEQEAWVDVYVGRTGDVKADVKVAFTLRDQLPSIGADVALALFPSGQTRVAIDPNDGGADYVVVRVSNAYEPGPSPSLAFDSAPLVRALESRGLTDVRLRFCSPEFVDTTLTVAPIGQSVADCQEWRLTPATQQVVGVLQMRPHASRWLPAAALAVLVGAAVPTAVFVLRRRRSGRASRAAIFGALVSSVLSSMALTAVGSSVADNLGVAGALGGLPLKAVSLARWLLVPLWLALLAIIGMSLSPMHRDRAAPPSVA